MVAVPSPIYPVAARFLNIAREAASGTPATTGFAEIPVVGFEPDPKITWLEDRGLRGSMTSVYDLLPGPYWQEATIPASPLFGDTIGHILLNVFGDVTDSGTAATPTWTTSGALSPGAGPIAVTSGASAVAGTYIQVGTAAGTTEVVKVGTGSTATSIVLDATTPLRLSHLTGVTITTVVAPFTHIFSVKNPASLTGDVSGQPPSHTIVDRNQTAGSGGFYGDIYPYACFNQLKLSGAATGLLTWDGTVISWPQVAAAGAITGSPSAVRGIPAWKGTSTVGGSTVNDVSDWEITIARETEPIPTVDGAQSPFVIARGPLDGTFQLNYSPALDQSPLTNLTGNVQPSFLWTTSNGLSGASLVSFSVAAQLGASKDAKLHAEKTVFGYSVTGQCIANTTNVGGGGGFGPCTITLINAIPAY